MKNHTPTIFPDDTNGSWAAGPRNGVLNNARDDTLVIDVKINRIA